MDSIIDRVRSLVRLSASSTSEEEARTSGRTACKLIVEKKILLSFKEPPEDEQSLEYLTEEARLAIERLQRRREKLGHDIPSSPADDAAASANKAQAPSPHFSIRDYLSLGEDAFALRCRDIRCRGNKPCAACRRFMFRALARAIETELRFAWVEAVRTRMLQAFMGYLVAAWENVVSVARPKRHPKTETQAASEAPRRLVGSRRELTVIDGGKK